MAQREFPRAFKELMHLKRSVMRYAVQKVDVAGASSPHLARREVKVGESCRHRPMSSYAPEPFAEAGDAAADFLDNC